MSDPALRLLTEEGYDPAFGETLFWKAISREIETPPSREILSGRVQDGPVSHMDDQNEKLSFDTGVPNQPAQCTGAILSSGMVPLYCELTLFSGREHLS